jgi:radical SAM protein with 4Fe4S-binding SPASM domain
VLRIFYRAVNRWFYPGEKVAEQLARYFPTYASAHGESRNQLHRILGRTSAYALQGVQIEPTDHCNLRCGHCSIHGPGSPERHRGFMSWDLFTRIVDENPALTCMILVRNGEPLLHPGFFDMVAYAAARGIHVSTYTNGSLLLGGGRLERLFGSGLGEIVFSLEAVGDAYERLRGCGYARFEAAVRATIAERDARGSPLRVGINVARAGTEDDLSAVLASWEDVVDHVYVEPLMGSEAGPRGAPCRTLWRNLVVGWDGTVVPCCVDMMDSLVVGDANQAPLAEIFQGARVRALRRAHLEGRYPPICERCSAHFG